MKKQMTLFFIVTLVFLLLSTNLIYSQVGINKGIKVGLNMATIAGDDNKIGGISPDSRMGFSAGGFIVLDLTVISIRPEILYTMKGACYEATVGNVKFDATLKLDYLEVPILLQYNLPLPGPVSPSLFAGPALAFNLSAKVVEETSDTEEDIEDVKSTDLGLVIGGGVVLNNKITLDVRLVMGLTSIDDSGADDDVKNQVISIMAGYMF